MSKANIRIKTKQVYRISSFLSVSVLYCIIHTAIKQIALWHRYHQKNRTFRVAMALAEKALPVGARTVYEERLLDKKKEKS